MGGLRLLDSHGRRLYTRKVPAVTRQFVRDAAVATTQLEQSPRASGNGELIQYAGYRRQQISMGLIKTSLGVAVAGYVGVRQRAASP